MPANERVLLANFRLQFSSNAGKTLRQVQSTIIRFVGAISAASDAIRALTFPITQAIQFERALQNVQKTTEFSDAAIKRFGKELKDISSRIDTTAQELAKIATIAGQLGLGREGTASVLAFTESVARAASTLDLTAQKAAEVAAQIANIFKIPIRQTEQIFSTINELSNTSVATADQLTDIIKRVGNIAGATFPQVSALAARAIDVGISSEVAGTALSKFFGNFQEKADQFAAAVGISTQEWLDTLNKAGTGPIDALKKIAVAINKIGGAEGAVLIKKLFGGGRLFSFATKLINDVGDGFVDLDKHLKNANDSFQDGQSAIDEYQKILAATDTQIKILGNRFTNLSSTAGEKFLPIVGRAVEALQEFLVSAAVEQAISQLSDALAIFAGIIEKVIQTLAKYPEILQGLVILFELIVGFFLFKGGAGILKFVFKLANSFFGLANLLNAGAGAALSWGRAVKDGIEGSAKSSIFAEGRLSKLVDTMKRGAAAGSSFGAGLFGPSFAQQLDADKRLTDLQNEQIARRAALDTMRDEAVVKQRLIDMDVRDGKLTEEQGKLEKKNLEASVLGANQRLQTLNAAVLKQAQYNATINAGTTASARFGAVASAAFAKVGAVAGATLSLIGAGLKKLFFALGGGAGLAIIALFGIIIPYWKETLDLATRALKAVAEFFGFGDTALSEEAKAQAEALKEAQDAAETYKATIESIRSGEFKVEVFNVENFLGSSEQLKDAVNGIIDDVVQLEKILAGIQFEDAQNLRAQKANVDRQKEVQDLIKIERERIANSKTQTEFQGRLNRLLEEERVIKENSEILGRERQKIDADRVKTEELLLQAVKNFSTLEQQAVARAVKERLKLIKAKERETEVENELRELSARLGVTDDPEKEIKLESRKRNELLKLREEHANLNKEVEEGREKLRDLQDAHEGLVSIAIQKISESGEPITRSIGNAVRYANAVGGIGKPGNLKRLELLQKVFANFKIAEATLPALETLKLRMDAVVKSAQGFLDNIPTAIVKSNQELSALADRSDEIIRDRTAKIKLDIEIADIGRKEKEALEAIKAEFDARKARAGSAGEVRELEKTQKIFENDVKRRAESERSQRLLKASVEEEARLKADILASEKIITTSREDAQKNIETATSELEKQQQIQEANSDAVIARLDKERDAAKEAGDPDEEKRVQQEIFATRSRQIEAKKEEARLQKEISESQKSLSVEDKNAAEKIRTEARDQLTQLVKERVELTKISETGKKVAVLDATEATKLLTDTATFLTDSNNRVFNALDQNKKELEKGAAAQAAEIGATVEELKKNVAVYQTVVGSLTGLSSATGGLSAELAKSNPLLIQRLATVQELISSANTPFDVDLKQVRAQLVEASKQGGIAFSDGFNNLLLASISGATAAQLKSAEEGIASFASAIKKEAEKPENKPDVTPTITWDGKQAQTDLNKLKLTVPVTLVPDGSGIVAQASGEAKGGYIKGPGTGTSDSILSWLSNGEYVIDARTTRKFGPGFFKTLQAMGKSSSPIKMPTFAEGGPVGLIEQVVNSGRPVDQVELLISPDGGKTTVPLVGDRDKVLDLVQALKNMGRGVVN